MSLTPTDNAYSQLLRQFGKVWKDGEFANIRRYHGLGDLFNTFCGGMDRAAYGERKVDHLVEDLTQAGIFREGEDGRRRLYWARGVYRVYPDAAVLDQLAERGLTVTHLKALLSVSDTLRPQAEQLLLRGGKVVPSREFITSIEKLCSNTVRDEAQAAIATGAPIPAQAPAAEDEGIVIGPDTAQGDGGPELQTPTAADAHIPEAAATRGVGDDAPTSQRAIKDMDKALIRVMALVPDVVISVRGRAREGFDSDPARRKFYESLRNIQVAIHDLAEPLTVLAANIGDELGSDVDAVPRPD